MANLYYNAAVDAAWDTLGNWWTDSAFTNPALALPATGDTVYLAAGMDYGPSTSVTLNHIYVADASTGGGYFGVTFTGATGDATFNDLSYNNGGTINGTATFNGSSYNGGTVTGNATFNDSSYNDATSYNIYGDATFNDNSYNYNSVIYGTATFNDYSYSQIGYINFATFNNYSISINDYIVAYATFNDFSICGSYVQESAGFGGDSINNGTIEEYAGFVGNSVNNGTIRLNAEFHDSSRNTGTVNGNATVYYDGGNGQRPIGGTVGGTVTYIGFPAIPLIDGCQAYWNLNDDGSGGVSLVDSTGNGYTLTNNNGVTLGTGIIDGDAVYDGTGGNLTTGSLDIGGATSLSLSCWLNTTDDVTTDIHLIGKWDVAPNPKSFLVYLNSGVLTFYTNNGSSSYSMDAISNVFDGSWHHIVCVYSYSTMEIFVDGVSQGTIGAGSSLASGAGFGIGNATYEGEYLYTGSIDEVGIWNRALDSTDVAALYNEGRGFTYPFFDTLYYNNAQEDGDWGNLLNWWKDSGFTVQATALPMADNPVNLYGTVTQNTQGANQCFCKSASFWSSDFGPGLTLQSTGVVNVQGSSIFSGNTTDSISMHDFSQLADTSVVEGNATMRGASRAFGIIFGNATVYYDGGNGQFPIGGGVGGSVTYIGWPAATPQWFNDAVSGGGNDGDFSNLANWWADNTYTTRPINAEGSQELPDVSTDVFIAPNRGFYANTGTLNPTVNSITTNNGYIQNISITVSNGAFFSGDDYYGIYEATIYGNVTFSGTAYNERSVIIGNADYKSAMSLVEAFNFNSLQRLTSGGAYGSNTMTVNIPTGNSQKGFLSSLLGFPWYIRF